MNQNEQQNVWSLISGKWLFHSEYGYIPERIKNRLNLNTTLGVLKQLYSVSSSQTKIYPPEFKYDPDTGEPLSLAIKSKGLSWLAPFGQQISLKNERRMNNGLKQTKNLRLLKNQNRNVSDAAEHQILYPLNGKIEFFSIRIGSDKYQLIALNKNKGDLYLYIAEDKSWKMLSPSASRLAPSVKELDEDWGMEAHYDESSFTDVLLLPTQSGLAEVTIDGISLEYYARYIGKGKVLSKPVVWHHRILFPLLCGDKIEIWDYKDAGPVVKTELKQQFFKEILSESRTLIFLSDHGQLILSLNDDDKITAQSLPWRPTYKPDFRFGPAFVSRDGDMFQLGLDTQENSYVYLKLNMPIHLEPYMKSCGRPRFTTGSTSYNFEEKISSRKKRDDIWAVEKQTDHHEVLVPLVEHADQEQDLVLGLSFLDNPSEAILNKLENKEKRQSIALFIDSPNEGVYKFYRTELRDPLQSRFFYHENYLYFYHPDLEYLQAWEVVA